MPIIEVSTRLRPASARRSASARSSPIAGGSASGRSVRIAAGAVRSISSSSEPAPTTSSMAATSASSGPMWRSTKAPGASRSASERAVMLAFLAIGRLRSALARDEVAIGPRVHQAVELRGLGDLDLAEPAGTFGVAVDQRRIVVQGIVRLDHPAADRRVDIACRLDALDNRHGGVLGDLAADLRQLDEHHVAQLLLGMVRDADRRDLAVDAHPFVLLGV